MQLFSYMLSDNLFNRFCGLFLLPKSLLGRTIFLWIIIAILNAFGSVFISAITKFFLESNNEAGAFKIFCAIFSNIMNAFILMFIAIAFIWLILYVSYRFLRNAPMLATQYARIWFATLLFAFIPPINDLFVDGKLIHFACATTLSIIMWCIFVPTIYRTFCKFAPEGEARWKDELSSRVFRTELRNYLRKNFPHLKSFIFLTMLFLVSIVFLSEFSL